MPDLQTDGSAEERTNKKRQRLKIIIIFKIFQMLRRLLFFLAQLKAGNNSKTLKNEIRQLLYLLYRSKKLSKTIYNNFINTI